MKTLELPPQAQIELRQQAINKLCEFGRKSHELLNKGIIMPFDWPALESDWRKEFNATLYAFTGMRVDELTLARIQIDFEGE